MNDSPNAAPADRRPPAAVSKPPSLRRLLVGAALGVSLLTLAADLVLPVSTAVAALAAKPGVVTLTDGKTLEGDVTEGGENVTVNANGIVTTVPRTGVKSIEYGTPQERLQKKLDAVPQSDYAGRLAVGQEGLRAGLLDFAQTAADNVLRDKPGDAAANALLDAVSRQRRLNRSSGTGVRPGKPGPQADADVQQPGVPVTAEQTLSEEQINIVRQAELQPGDANARQKPRIQFRDNLIKRFGDSQKNFNYARFNALPDVTKAIYILSEGDAAMRADVRVTSDPPAVLEYLRAVEPFVLNGCATSGCHGGTKAGAFVLYPTPRDEAASYTNFYILNTYAKKEADPAGGAFGGGELTRRLIDRDKPDDSLLLSYILPSNLAKYAHPKVDNWNGLVDGTNNANFQTIRNWIGDGLGKGAVKDGYGLDFKVPTGQTATPATTPADDGGK